MLNNFRGKHRLLMKFAQFILHYKRNNFIKKFNKNCDLQLVPDHFVFAKT